MKKCLVVIFALSLLLFPSLVIAGGGSFTTIQDGVLTYSAGHYLGGKPLTVGFDPYGYNYQGHMFKGYYVNSYLGKDGLPPYNGDERSYLQANPGAASKWYWPYRDVTLEMKWNDAWLSNKDCNGDGLLDRASDNGGSYIGSGAWITNHMIGGKGKDGWVYFTKIAAAPADAVKKAGVWYTADGAGIGPVIWGDFAVLQEVESGSGALYISPVGPGFGKY